MFNKGTKFENPSIETQQTSRECQNLNLKSLIGKLRVVTAYKSKPLTDREYPYQTTDREINTENY